MADEAVVKWLLPPVMTPHPGVELLVHLESRGFGAMPRFLGVEQRDGLVLALATEYVPGAQDGWDWFVDDVDSWLRGSLAPADVIAGATRMGALTAQLHAALADLQPAAVAARTYHVQATERLDDAMRLVGGEEGALRDLAPAVLRAGPAGWR